MILLRVVDDGRMPDVVRRGSAPDFIGRRELLTFFDQELAAARLGRGDVVLVAGEAGVGKSRLIRAWIERAEAANALMAVGQCVEHGAQSMPLAPVTDLLRTLTQHLTHAHLTEVFTPIAGDLSQLLPDLFPPMDGAKTTDPSSVARLSSGLLQGLVSLSRRNTVLVVIEDMQWADESTRRLVAYLAPRLREHAIVLVASYRSDDLHRTHPLRPLLVSLERAVRPERIELAPFTIGELTELMLAVTGQNPEYGEIASLHRRSGGNGFIAEELLAADDGSPHPPTLLRDAVLSRTRSLDASQLALLRAAAVAGPSVDAELIGIACDLPPNVVTRGTEAIVDSGLWIRDSHGSRFRHELAREVIENDLSPGENPAVHAAVAAAMTALQPQRHGEIGRHWMAAGEYIKAWEAAIAAAGDATQVGADAEALLQYESALVLWDRVPDAGRRAGRSHAKFLLEAADTAGMARSYSRAIALGRSATAELHDDPQTEGRAWLRLAEWAWFAEHEPDADRFIDRALRLIPAEPVTADRALAVAWHGLLLDDIGAPEGYGRAAEGLRLAQVCGSHRAEAHALITLAAIKCRSRDAAGLADLRAGLTFALENRLSLESARAYDELTAKLYQAAQYDAVLDTAGEALDFCAAAGLRRTFGVTIESTVISSLQHLGRWQDAERRVDDLRSEFGHLKLEHFTLAGSWGRILVRQGRLDGVRAMVADALRRMHDHPHVLGPTTTTAVELASAAGRFAEIPQLVDSVMDSILPGHPLDAAELVAAALGALADQAIKIDTNATRQRGQRWLAQIEMPSNQLPTRRANPELTARLLLIRTELSRLSGSPDLENWETLITAWDDLHAPYERAYAQLRLAMALLIERSGQSADSRTRARALLSGAHQSAVSLMATPIVAEIEACASRAHLRLDLHGAQHTSPGNSDDRLGLTPREFDVLRLVADGYSNGQIGEALFISRKTASVHVSNILRKLGVSSRLQAANVMTRPGGAGRP